MAKFLVMRHTGHRRDHWESGYGRGRHEAHREEMRCVRRERSEARLTRVQVDGSVLLWCSQGDAEDADVTIEPTVIATVFVIILCGHIDGDYRTTRDWLVKRAVI